VIKNQHLLEQGTHEQLLAKDGLYASLFKIQSGDVAKLKEWDLVR
jgi:ABC-type multidrug transport system fused ATPase/permease subunit